MSGQRKIFLLGLDGVPPSALHNFVQGGWMPNLARLLESSMEVDVIPAMPPLTAPGWLSIASGSHPSTVGVENILLPDPDGDPDVIRNGFDASFSNAEYIWETLDSCGMQAIVLKYPGSWPPRAGGFLQVDGAGGYADITCRFEALSSRAYKSTSPGSDAEDATRLVFPEGYEEHWRIHTDASEGISEVVTRDPSSWIGVPWEMTPVFEFVLHLKERCGERSRPLQGLCLAEGERLVLVLSPDKNVGNTRAVQLLPGAWSPFVEEFSRQGQRYAVRFKLIELHADTRSFHIYQSQGHLTDGYTSPDDLAGELHESVGPIVEWTGTYDFFNGLIDLETEFEIYEQHTNWLIRTIQHMARSRGQWRGFFTHWHLIEYAHHLVGSSLHQDHPLHCADFEAGDMHFLSRVYGLADRLIGAVQEVIDQDTLFTIASDHGHDLLHTLVYINEFLRRRGWLVTKSIEGKEEIDWTKTSAYALFPGCIFFNLTDTRPNGIVAQGDVRPLTDAVTEGLRALVDPRTGEHPVSVVLDRDELKAFGQVGPRAPDLLFCLVRGYEAATRLVANPDEGVEFELTQPRKSATSGHGSFFPMSASARTLAVFSGPGVDKVTAPLYPVRSIDIAPTLTRFLGIRPPRDCEGSPIFLTRAKENR